MYSIDFQNQLNDYLLDEERKIPDAHLDSVCKKGQKEKTCKYISLTMIGFVCAKKTPVKAKLDEMARDKKMSAQSDNCEGLGK